MSKIFIVSDTHFGHFNCIKHDNRPFATVEEMDNTIIENWNKQVQMNDTVWFLGDFCFRSKVKCEDYLAKLNGKIHVVAGNHDDSKGGIFYCRDKVDSYQDYKYLRINNEKIAMFHYKIHTWRSCHRGTWHLFGHSHGGLNPVHGKCLDVGIMCHDYKLWEFDEIKAYMDSRPLIPHHGETRIATA